MPQFKLSKKPFNPPEPKEGTVAKYNGNTKYDWPAIKKDYINGYEKEDEPGVIYYPNTKELSERYPDVPYGQIRNRCSKEKWEDYKQKNMRAAAIEQHKERLKKLNKQAIAFDAQAAEDASFAQGLMRKQLDNYAKLMEIDELRVIGLIDKVMSGDDIHKDDLKPFVSPSGIESIAKAYALFNEVGRKALGIKDDEPAVHQQVNIVTQTNTTVTQELQKVDPARLAALQRILTNENMVLPGGMRSTIKGDIVDGEVREITDGREEVQASEEAE